MYGSVDSDNKTTIDLYKTLSTLWNAGMHARKWLSNLEELLWEISIAKTGFR